MFLSIKYEYVDIFSQIRPWRVRGLNVAPSNIFPRMSKNALWLDAPDLSNCTVPWKELLFHSIIHMQMTISRVGNKCIVQKSGHLCGENSVDFSPMMMGSVLARAHCLIWKFSPHSKNVVFYSYDIKLFSCSILWSNRDYNFG